MRRRKLVGISAYPSCIVKEWLEQLIIPPHVSRLQAEPQSGLVSHPNTHNLVKVISGGLGRREIIGVKNSDIRRRVSGSKEVEGSRGPDRPTTSNDDDLCGFSGFRHGVQKLSWTPRYSGPTKPEFLGEFKSHCEDRDVERTHVFGDQRCQHGWPLDPARPIASTFLMSSSVMRGVGTVGPDRRYPRQDWQKHGGNPTSYQHERRM